VKATFDALDVVHESGILCRDVRCNNMVVKRRRGGVGSIDFGFPRPITSSEDFLRECVHSWDIRVQTISSEYCYKELSSSIYNGLVHVEFVL
jgi:tRNA A-37 threonylcarbamoyl transferase component Bud32